MVFEGVEKCGLVMSKIGDNTRIWFGVHKGTKMKDIPDGYFKYLLDNGISFKSIKHYTKVFRGIK